MATSKAARGTGEGFRPFDLAPGSTMTNANISAMIDSVSGPKLTLTYKGGEQTVVVDKSTPIVTFAPGTSACDESYTKPETSPRCRFCALELPTAKSERATTNAKNAIFQIFIFAPLFRISYCSAKLISESLEPLLLPLNPRNKELYETF